MKCTKVPTLPICVTRTRMRSENVCSKISVKLPSRSRDIWLEDSIMGDGRKEFKLFIFLRDRDDGPSMGRAAFGCLVNLCSECSTTSKQRRPQRAKPKKKAIGTVVGGRSTLWLSQGMDFFSNYHCLHYMMIFQDRLNGPARPLFLPPIPLNLYSSHDSFLLPNNLRSLLRLPSLLHQHLTTHRQSSQCLQTMNGSLHTFLDETEMVRGASGKEVCRLTSGPSRSGGALQEGLVLSRPVGVDTTARSVGTWQSIHPSHLFFPVGFQ